MDASYVDVDNIEIPEVDVDIQEPQVIEIIYPNIPKTNPEPIEPATVHQADAALELMLSIHQVKPELHRSRESGPRQRTILRACQVLNTPMP